MDSAGFGKQADVRDRHILLHRFAHIVHCQSGGADSASLTAQELVDKGYLSPLPAGENYSVSITKTGDRYDVTVTPITGSE